MINWTAAAVLVAAAGLAGTAVIGALRFVWWLRGQFQAVKDAGQTRWETVKETFEKKVDDHETKDQERHEDNLRRFGEGRDRMTSIEAKLSTLIRNGNGTSYRA